MTVIKIHKRIELIFTILFIGSLMLAIYGFYLFMIGFHNFDSAQNYIFFLNDVQLDLERIDIDYDVGYYEETTLGNQRITFEDSYKIGIRQTIEGVFIMMFSFFLMGYSLARIEK
jgi:hypothetical protein